MSVAVEVQLWGRRIGAAALLGDSTVASFEYTPEFVSSGIEVAPLMMPLSGRLFTFPSLPAHSFHGLPGLLADSIPDRYGNALIDAWLARQGRNPGSLNPIERLSYVGSRGMGALEYRPAFSPGIGDGETLHVSELAELAHEVLDSRRTLRSSFSAGTSERAIRDILRVGTSAGGARPKALIAWNPVTNEVRSGQVTAGDGFESWLLKFDGVTYGSSFEVGTSTGHGAVEYGYYLMALDAGIDMRESRLFRERDRQHFMTRRFDRDENGQRLHMQSLGALAHFDFNSDGAYAYEQVLLIIRQLRLGMETTEKMFRRMVFNAVTRNQDDHVKNIAFLMDRTGTWSLSPAFDVVWSFNPEGRWTSRHQMTINGKRDGFEFADFKDVAQGASMKRGRAQTIVEEVLGAAAKWPQHAAVAGVTDEQMAHIGSTFRTF